MIYFKSSDLFQWFQCVVIYSARELTWQLNQNRIDVTHCTVWSTNVDLNLERCFPRLCLLSLRIWSNLVHQWNSMNLSPPPINHFGSLNRGGDKFKVLRILRQTPIWGPLGAPPPDQENDTENVDFPLQIRVLGVQNRKIFAPAARPKLRHTPNLQKSGSR